MTLGETTGKIEAGMPGMIKIQCSSPNERIPDS